MRTSVRQRLHRSAMVVSTGPRTSSMVPVLVTVTRPVTGDTYSTSSSS